MSEQYDPPMRYTEGDTNIVYNNVPFKDMAWSDEHKNIFKAWANAKKEMPITVAKDAINPHFGKKYSTLDASLEVGIPVFAKHGISVIQMPTDDQLLNLMTHESGEWIAFRYKMQIKEQTAQGRGSALTYARRYCFQSLAGLAPGDDDDAESSMQRGQKQNDKPKESKPKTPRKKPSEQAKEWEKEMAANKAFDDKTVPPIEVDPQPTSEIFLDETKPPPAADPPADYEPDGIAKILSSQIPRQKTAESLEGISVRVQNETLDDTARQYLEELIAKQRKEMNA